MDKASARAVTGISPLAGGRGRRKDVLLRGKSNGKLALREKFVVIYEAFFEGQDVSKHNANFWEELFLLRVNMAFLEDRVGQAKVEELFRIQAVLNEIFHHALLALASPSRIKVAHALETMTVLLHCIFRKKFNNFGFDAFKLICGFDKADAFFTGLFEAMRVILDAEEVDAVVCQGALTLLAVVVTATDNLNQNAVLEYACQVDLLPSLFRMLRMEAISAAQRVDLCYCLALLVNYKKYEAQLNPYHDAFCSLSLAEGWPAFAAVMREEIRRVTVAATGDSYEGGMMSSLASVFTTWLPLPSAQQMQLGSPKLVMQHASAILLLPVYDATCLSKHFRKLIAQARPASSADADDGVPLLLQEMLRFSSFIFDDVQDMRQACLTKMALITFLCLMEDDASATFMHSSEHGCLVPTKLNKSLQKRDQKRPVICIVLDLLIHFLKSNLKKQMHYDLYYKALAIIQRVICFEKKHRTLVPYDWKLLWDALFVLAIGVTTIFNLFITYGDTFLGKNADYDELYYQLIHESKLLHQLYRTAENCNSGKHLVQQLENIRTICRHFGGKLDQWQNDNPNATLSQEQVMAIIRNNYVTLKLNLLDGLDQFEPYGENPREVNFFRKYLRLAMLEFRASIEVLPLRVKVM